ncbi:MAG TPA: FecR domain-containing protein [Stellaceae bacterium]|nr:FecR domain-containing protein [Stellaceae bacterium]
MPQSFRAAQASTRAIAGFGRRLLPVLPLLAIWALPAAAQEKIGVASAVNPDVTGAGPRGQARQIVIGQDVVYNEHIATAAAGQTQILFLDESSLSVGPNSDITIDEFIYDPRTRVGKLVISASRGVLRYIGGRISKNENGVTIRAPAATIGIRGGVVLLSIAPAGKTDVIAVHPERPTVVGQNGVVRKLARDNDMVSVAGPDTTPSAPAPAPTNLAAHLLSQTTIGGR